VAISPDGQTLATCGNDQAVRLWSATDGQPIGELIGHDTHVYNLAFHPAGRDLVSGDLKGVVKQWDLGTKQAVRELDGRRFFVTQSNLRLGGIRGMTFDPIGARLACSGMSGFGSIGDGIGAATVMLFDWASGLGTHVFYPKEPLRSFVNGAAFHPAGFVLGAAGGLDMGMLFFWKPEPVELPPPSPPAAAQPAASPPATAAAPPPMPFKPREQQSFHHFKMPQSGWGMDIDRTQTRIAVAHHDHVLRIYSLLPPPPKPAAPAAEAPAKT
jgi:hypothetical protein